jgi:hypothetical protein
MLAQVIHVQQPFDWVTQVVVPFVAAILAAGIGAGAVLFATQQQVNANAAALTTQLKEERDAAEAARTEERKAALLDLLIAAKEELTVNVESLAQRGPAWTPLSAEFTHRLLVSNRLGDPMAQRLLTVAYLAIERYNAAVAVANRHPNPPDSPMATVLKEGLPLQAKQDMENAAKALGKQITVFPVEELPLSQ